MDDAEFEDRVKAIEWMVSFVASPPEVLNGKRVVEIGSGFGCGAIAALRNGAASYLGIEPEPFGSRIVQLEGNDPGYRAHYERAARAIDKLRVRFFEGFADEWPADDFDIVLIADVLEHVDDPASIARAAARLLKPGGHVIASTGPLYHSAQGHHLFDVFRDQPWAHLRADFDDRFLPSVVSDYLLAEYRALNGVTHGQLVAAFADAGLIIVSARTVPDESADFSQFEQLIAPTYRQRFDRSVFVESVSQIYACKPAAVEPAPLSRRFFGFR